LPRDFQQAPGAAGADEKSQKGMIGKSERQRKAVDPARRRIIEGGGDRRKKGKGTQTFWSKREKVTRV